MTRALLPFSVAVLVVCSLAGGPVAVAQDPSPAPDAPPAMAGQAVSLLPPGNSGFFSVEGQASGMAGGSYGDNIDDQSALYWGLEGYAGQGFADPADAVRTESLLDGAVRVYWDAFGVPAIYGDTGRDAWYGAGYAIAEIRLFLMDAVRRQGRGTFAELVGPSGVPLDVQTRTLTYTDEEYQAMLDSLSPESREAIEGYVDGANARIAEVNADPSLLPAEYALLSTQPAPLTAIDVVAAGVLITRTVASEGGQEMENVRLLRELESSLGVEAGRGVFTDLVWNDDDLAVTTVPREEGVFPANAVPDEAAAFDAMADYAATLPLELETGNGTGAYPEPASGPSSSFASSLASSLDAPSVALEEWASSLHGGSIGVAIGPSRTADAAAMLVSGPQLGYSYPSLLVELEVHGGGYDARGASVPALPTVGIGYTDRVAWALTTGYSKTIDSFIETVRVGADGQLEYLHEDAWQPASCRDETVSFREGTMGAPVTPALRSVDVPVCRTVHGPIVAQQAAPADGSEFLARSVQYQMWGAEVDTIEGVLAWNRARTFEEFEAAMRQVTWNENTTYADADGHIAYWHPGIHHARPAGGDQRLPLPGDGTMDFGERLPFESLPHAVDPAQGYLANWNNKPAGEWFDGIGTGSTSRPGGAFQRVRNAMALVEARADHDFESMQALEVEAGLQDVRRQAFLPVLASSLSGASLSERETEALALLVAWNGRHYDPASSSEGTDGPAATIFSAVVDALVVEVLGDVAPDLVARQLGVGSHQYDMSPAHNLVLRVLDPASSSLEPSRDYLSGRSASDVVVVAFRSALASLAEEYGSEDLAAYRRPTHMSEVSSLTEVIGPSTTQPYMDRGSYVHVVAFDALPRLSVERAAGAERVRTSVAASALAFPDGASSVVIADAASFADALAAAPLAGVLGAPILLVDESVSPEVDAELVRLGATNAVVVGGDAAVPMSVGPHLADNGIAVERIAGPDRFATSEAIARRVIELRSGARPETGPDAYIASGTSFADALSIAAVAARTSTPVLLSGPDTSSVREELGLESVVLVGGTAAVPDYPGASRLAGPGRYETAEQVLRHARSLGLSFGTLLVATGSNFPDGLAAGAVAAATDGLVVLADGLNASDPGAAVGYAASQRASVDRVVILGGDAVVADAVAALLT